MGKRTRIQCSTVPLLRPPAVIVFDDYDVDVPAEMPLADGVRGAVDSFLAVAGDRVAVLHRGRQVIARVVHDLDPWPCAYCTLPMSRTVHGVQARFCSEHCQLAATRGPR